LRQLAEGFKEKNAMTFTFQEVERAIFGNNPGIRDNGLRRRGKASPLLARRGGSPGQFLEMSSASVVPKILQSVITSLFVAEERVRQRSNGVVGCQHGFGNGYGMRGLHRARVDSGYSLKPPE
jgi:hypothetical protein